MSMKRLFSFLFLITLILVQMPVYADGVGSLMLTDAEMQKLKSHFPTDETVHSVWKGDPIQVQLPVGKEKRLVFSDNVTVDLKGALTTDQLRLLNNDKSVYVTALTAFETTRVYVTLQKSGKVMLIDLSTSESAGTAAHYIESKNEILPKTKDIINTTSVQTELADSSDSSDSADVTYVDLMRFAWQQLYAPERLLTKPPRFMRAAMHTEPFLSDLVYGDKVIAHPEGSWMAANHYVTVITLQNKYPHRTVIDIRKDLCGDWRAATIYPRSILKPHGEREGDTTTLILVSQKSFGDTMGVCHGDA